MVAYPLRQLDADPLDRGTVARPRQDAQWCERIVRRHARTFSLASYFLPPHKRRAAFALYAFCRLADDLVDLAETRARGVLERQLRSYEQALRAAVAGRPSGPVFRELAWAVETFGVPLAVLEELLAGVARDLTPARYESWDELGKYCEGVASTVGEMCTHVFGVRGGPAARERALRYARTLGVAMQLTNVLRDVGEDARRGRCYLPEEDLVSFGLAPDEVLALPAGLATDGRWQAFMGFQVARARALYAAAAPGITLLEADAQPCAAACSTGYEAILGALETIGYDSLSTRARVGHLGRAAILWEVWRTARREPLAPTTHDGPAVAWAPIGLPSPTCLTRSLA